MSDTSPARPAPKSGLRERAITAAIIAPLGIAAVLFLPAPWFALFIGTLFLIGAWEWTMLAGWRHVALRALIVALHGALMLSLRHAGPPAWPQAIWAGVGFWLIAPLWLRSYHFGQPAEIRSLTIKTIASMLAIVPAWTAAVSLEGGSRGPHWLLFLLVLVWCADTCAYFAGRRFGTTKLAPQISPGKTTAGVYGALLGCTVYGAAVGHFVFDVSGEKLVLLVALCVVVVVFSIVGDLLESLLKRHSQMKDSGNLFPGHGGMLDRFDSLFAALPIFVAGRHVLGL